MSISLPHGTTLQAEPTQPVTGLRPPLRELAERVSGRLHTLLDDDWAAACVPWRVNVEQHPMAVLDAHDLTGATLVTFSAGSGEAVRTLTRHGRRRVARLALIGPTTPLLARRADNPGGVDPALFDPAVVAPARLARLARNWHLPVGALTVLLLGRFARWKGHGVLIEAVARMGRRDVILVLAGAAAGRGRYVAELLAQARAAGIADRVHVAHDLDDVPAAMMLPVWST